MTIDNTLADKPGLVVKGTDQLLQEIVANMDSVTDAETKEMETFKISLAGHIRDTFRINKNARRESGVEQEMINSLFAVNMQYQAHELAGIKTGSKIYMGLTATKSRAARSWIKDLIQPALGVPFRIDPSEVEELPEKITKIIDGAFQEDASRLQSEIEAEVAEEQKLLQTGSQETPPPQEGQPAPPPPPKSALVSVKKLKRTNELRRDVEEGISSEINKIAKADIKKIEKSVIDQLQDGSWDEALSDFIEDFTIYPTAFMKGPVVTTDKRMVWKNGVAVPLRKTIFQNQRVSPFDVYPSPSAKTIYDGNFCEHIRLTKKDLSALSHLDEEKTGFRPNTIIDILRNVQPGSTGNWIDTEIEEHKIIAEKRGNQTAASEGIYHGVHFWGTVSVDMLLEWRYSPEELSEYNDWEEVEVEAMMIGDKVIKCMINRDPLGRRPYYSGSFQTRSGSLWGKSLPSLMRDIQRMCNACARALADNMGLSSGPQVGIIVDRLADDGAIDEMEPRKIWQFTADPAGNSGKPIEFFIVPSNANELLAVYDKFEVKADDVTGVPRYAYGNESVGGAGQTAKGLSMLLESASKGIKASIKNISEGLLTPRVEYQFYLHLLNEMESGNQINFSGDINIVVHAAEAMTIKAAEIELQRELLTAITSTPVGERVLGLTGYGELFRALFKGANLPEDAIPSRLELKEKEKAEQLGQAKAAEAAAASEDKKVQAGLQATTEQISGQERMHEGTQALKSQDMQLKDKQKGVDQQLKAVEIQQKSETESGKNLAKAQETDKKLSAEATNTDRKLAVDLVKSKKETEAPAKPKSE